MTQAGQEHPRDEAGILQGALVDMMDLHEDRRVLTFDLTLLSGNRKPGTEPNHQVRLRIPGVTNMARVRAFFFGRKLKPVGEYVDQVLDFKVTRSGCSIELKRAGRIAIRTPEAPTLEREEAVEQLDAADEARASSAGRRGPRS